MKAIVRHELSLYAHSLIGWIFGAFLLFFAGIYTMAINLNSSLANFAYVLTNLSFVFLIVVPILTMRTIAEEKRQRTDQLLYALPLTMTQVAAGKYAALLVVLAVPTGVLCLYPLVLSAFGAVSLPLSYGTLVGFFLLGAALLAVGLFLSSLTESQGAAAGLCFAVLLVNYFLSSLSGYFAGSAKASFVAFSVLIVLFVVIFRLMTGNTPVSLGLLAALEATLAGLYLWTGEGFAGLFPALLEKLSLFDRFYTFADGIFDVQAAVFFLTVIGIFLFLTVQSLEKRRWSA